MRNKRKFDPEFKRIRPKSLSGGDYMKKKQVLLGVDALNIPTFSRFFANRDKFSVTIVDDGDEALRCITRKKPDIAILNLNLPKKGGDECCREVKKGVLSPGTLIVLMPWLHKSGEIGRCVDAECDVLLTQPLEYNRLAEIVTRLLFMEKNISSRLDVHLPVSYGITLRNMTEKSAVDLSPGGIFLKAQHVEPVGTPLWVVFTLPADGTTVRCKARVAWLHIPEHRSEPMHPAGMGLEFTDIADRDVSAIRRFLFSGREWGQA